MSFVTEVYHFILTHRKYWLISIIMVMLLFGGLMVLTYGLRVDEERAAPLDLLSGRLDVGDLGLAVAGTMMVGHMLSN
jgi:hypothetical protein